MKKSFSIFLLSAFVSIAQATQAPQCVSQLTQNAPIAKTSILSLTKHLRDQNLTPGNVKFTFETKLGELQSADVAVRLKLMLFDIEVGEFLVQTVSPHIDSPTFATHIKLRDFAQGKGLGVLTYLAAARLIQKQYSNAHLVSSNWPSPQAQKTWQTLVQMGVAVSNKTQPVEKKLRPFEFKLDTELSLLDSYL